MKKVLGVLLVVAIILLLLPLAGNKIAQEEIQKKIEVLTSYGVKVEKSDTQSSYFKTKNHYELSVQDTQKFLAYLNKYANDQIPPYVDAAFEGVLMGIDLEYCNFPLSDTLGVDIYPLTMPKELADEIKKSDPNFSVYLEKLLQTKGVFYHLDYAVASGEFSGFIKDIDEKIKLQNGADIEVVLKNATYEGKGPFMAPTRLSTNMETLTFDGHDDKTKFRFELLGMRSDATFESDTTYESRLDAKRVYFNLHEDAKEHFMFDFKGVGFQFASDARGAKAHATAKTGADEFSFTGDRLLLQAQKFNYALRFSEIDKDSYEKLSQTVKQMQRVNSYVDEDVILEAFLELLAKGIVIELDDLSIGSLSIENQKLQGASLQAKVTLKPDPDFAHNLNAAPLNFLNDLAAEATLRVSKELFGYLNKQAPMSAMALGYAVEEGNDYVYRVKFENNDLSINGKSL